MSCSNNFKQIGIAMHLYHDTNLCLPAAWSAMHPTTGQPYWLGQPGWAWGSVILPFIEQGAVEKTLIHRHLRITDPMNQAARLAPRPSSSRASLPSARGPKATSPKVFSAPDPRKCLANLDSARPSSPRDPPPAARGRHARCTISRFGSASSGIVGQTSWPAGRNSCARHAATWVPCAPSSRYSSRVRKPQCRRDLQPPHPALGWRIRSRFSNCGPT
jgi:hypothetical protein